LEGAAVAWGDEADRDEHRRRVDAAIARAAACHMSDAKWLKFFAVLRALDVGPLRWKFVRDDRVFVEPAPPAHAVLERALGDVPPYPYGPYREIEWVEVPAERAAGAIEALAAIGRFPVRQLDSGVRVVGYTW
jgi:hypothetical protein